MQIHRSIARIPLAAVVLFIAGLAAASALPEEQAALTYAPNVPPAIARKKPALVKVKLEAQEKEDILMEGFDEGTKYVFWTFNGHVPGPFIRAREGDTLEL